MSPIVDMSPCNRNTREQENLSQHNTVMSLDLHKHAAGTLTWIAVTRLGVGFEPPVALPHSSVVYELYAWPNQLHVGLYKRSLWFD